MADLCVKLGKVDLKSCQFGQKATLKVRLKDIEERKEELPARMRDQFLKAETGSLLSVTLITP
jgi:translation initiation factor IF-1